MGEEAKPAAEPLSPGDLRVSIVIGTACIALQGPPDHVVAVYQHFVEWMNSRLAVASFPSVSTEKGH